VFFVRVANKGLKLDAASTCDDEGFKWVVFSVGCMSDSMTSMSNPRKNERRFGWEPEVTSCKTLGWNEGAPPWGFA